MMRAGLFFLLIAAASGGVSAGQPSGLDKASSVERTKKEVLKVEQELNRAVLKNTGSTLGRLLADEIVWLTSSGEMLTKSQVLDRIGAGKQSEFSIHSEDKQVSVHGDTVIIYGDVKGRASGTLKDESSTSRVTEVFVKLGGQWKLVAFGETFVAKP